MDPHPDLHRRRLLHFPPRPGACPSFGRRTDASAARAIPRPAGSSPARRARDKDGMLLRPPFPLRVRMYLTSYWTASFPTLKNDLHRAPPWSFRSGHVRSIASTTVPGRSFGLSFFGGEDCFFLGESSLKIVIGASTDPGGFPRHLPPNRLPTIRAAAAGMEGGELVLAVLRGPVSPMPPDDPRPSCPSAAEGSPLTRDP